MSPRRQRWLRIAGLAVIAFVVFRLARTMQEGGHGWGDDFAMYINQARGLTDGTADEVVANNRYALDNSAYRFGPVAYPWGFPALLAPIVMVSGLDYDALKLVGTLSLVGAVLLYVHLLSSRLASWEVAVATAMIAANGWYLGWTDAVLSDLPFLFTVLLSLVLIDHLVRADRLLTASTAATLATAAVIAFSFNVRREGLVLLGALAAAQLVRVLALLRDEGVRTITAARDVVGPHWRPLAMPYVWFAAIVAAVQLARPATILSPSEHFGPSGTQNVRFNAEWYVDPLAELIGLKPAGPFDITLLGSTTLGALVLSAFLVAAVVGVVAAFVRTPRRDVHLAVALVGITLAVLVQPFREQRYLTSILPLLVYFALRGVRSAIGAVDAATGRRNRPVRLARLAVPALLMAGLFVGVADDAIDALDYHRAYDYVSWGPESPETQELFAAIHQHTDARDVVVFYQARTMNLYTQRRAIQGNNVPMMVERGDWYAMTKNSEYIQTPLSDAQAADLGFVKVWENTAFVLWSIPDRPVVELAP